MSVNCLSPVLANVQLPGCPAKASPQLATQFSQLLHLSHWRPLAQPQSSRHCASQRGGRLRTHASATQAPTQDLVKSQKVCVPKLASVPRHMYCSDRSFLMCGLLPRLEVLTACAGKPFMLLQAAPERVGDVMTKKHVYTCNPDTSIDDGQWPAFSISTCAVPSCPSCYTCCLRPSPYVVQCIQVNSCLTMCVTVSHSYLTTYTSFGPLLLRRTCFLRCSVVGLKASAPTNKL